MNDKLEMLKEKARGKLKKLNRYDLVYFLDKLTKDDHIMRGLVWEELEARYPDGIDKFFEYEESNNCILSDLDILKFI